MADKIYTTFVPTAPCSASDPAGRCIEAHFTIAGDTLTLCDESGTPLRNSWGDPIKGKIGDLTAAKVASRLALRHWRSTRDELEDFRRPLSGRDYNPVPY